MAANLTGALASDDVEEKPLETSLAFGPAQNRHIELVKRDGAVSSMSEGLPQKSIAQFIVGKWNISPNNRSSEGSIVFDASGGYEMKETLLDGDGVATKGEYKLDDNAEPSKIDLCLGKCDNPGSEWTTRFGIVRALSNGKVEIHISSDEKYPAVFSSDPLDQYTLVLTRTD